MSHVVVEGAGPGAGFPRTRGDEPITVFRYLDDQGFSPHTRG